MLSRFSFPFRHFPLLISICFALACGRQEYEVEHIQDFQLYIESTDEDINETMELLTETYNDDIGFQALSIVDERSDANSFIRFPRGLRSHDNKLGLGQWMTVMTQEGRDLFPSSQVLRRSIYYSMEIDFDYENVKSKAEKRNDLSSPEWAHLYHLFCHEIGHGLQMDHDEQKSSVMYRTIPENSRPNVDYRKYFNVARQFFERSGKKAVKSQTTDRLAEGRTAN